MSDLVWSKLQELLNDGLNAVNSASDESALVTLQKKYLGKKGEIQAYMQHMKELTPAERPKLGALVNEARDRLEAKFAEVEVKLQNAKLMADLKLRHEDLTLPGRTPIRGAEHILQKTQREIEDIFLSMGFEIS